MASDAVDVPSAHRFSQSPAFNVNEQPCIGLGQSAASWNSWNEPGGSGVDIGNLQAKTFDFQGPDNASRFDPGLVDFDFPLSRDPLRVEPEQEHAEAIPHPYTFDYSFPLAEVPAQATDHPLPPSGLEAPDTSSHPTHFWPAPPFDMILPTGAALPTGMALATGTSYPLLEAGPSGSPEDVLTPATPPPQTVDIAQLSRPMRNHKRLLAEEEDISDVPRLAKKRKGPRVERQSTTPRRTAARKNRAPKPIAAVRVTLSRAVAGPSNFGRAVADSEAASLYELGSDEEADFDSEDHLPNGSGTATTRTKRARRTKDQVKAVTRTDLQEVHCPVDGCETMFDPLTHDANRKHLERHYETGALDGKASLSCLWTWCEKTPIGTKMITHLHEHHVGRAFICSVKDCKWNWASSRSGDLPLHLARRHKS